MDQDSSPLPIIPSFNSVMKINTILRLHELVIRILVVDLVLDQIGVTNLDILMDDFLLECFVLIFPVGVILLPVLLYGG